MYNLLIEYFHFYVFLCKNGFLLVLDLL